MPFKKLEVVAIVAVVIIGAIAGLWAGSGSHAQERQQTTPRQTPAAQAAGPTTAAAAATPAEMPKANTVNGHKQYDAPPPMTIDVNKKYIATFDTAKGKIVCELFAKDAPITVNNFVFLARDGFYNGTTFHRVIADFMIQGGDPTATGRGGPGYRFQDELGPDKPRHQVGSLSMANAGPNTNGSQFFITHVQTSHLDGRHTVFGQCIEGQNVVNAIQKDDELKSVTITEK